MDKSTKYIRLCERAREIQGQWHQAYGDCFVGENGRIEYWITHKFHSRKVRRGFGIRCEGDVIHISPYIWLPRHDQLMEMVQVPGRPFDSISTAFFNWTRMPYGQGDEFPSRMFPTLEQVWLAFVMHRKYGKSWLDCEWARVPSNHGKVHDDR